MATSSDEEDFESFLSKIDNEVDQLGLPAPSTKFTHKTIHCFLCKETYEIPAPYRLRETCPDCYMRLKEYHGLKGPLWPPVERRKKNGSR